MPTSMARLMLCAQGAGQSDNVKLRIERQTPKTPKPRASEVYTKVIYSFENIFVHIFNILPMFDAEYLLLSVNRKVVVAFAIPIVLVLSFIVHLLLLFRNCISLK